MSDQHSAYDSIAVSLGEAQPGEPGPHTPSKAKTFDHIWKPFLILLGITVVEFVMALAIPKELMPQDIKRVLYVALTLLKAFYIVAFFMHLKFERLGLMYAITVPVLFIIALVVALLYEGGSHAFQ